MTTKSKKKTSLRWRIDRDSSRSVKGSIRGAAVAIRREALTRTAERQQASTAPKPAPKRAANELPQNRDTLGGDSVMIYARRHDAA